MDDMSKGEKMLLLFFTVVNYSVWVGSLAMMGLGTWMLIDPHRFDTLFADDDIKPMAAIILCLGFCLFFNGFFGCCGALQKRNSCLLIYVTVMLLITLGELIIVILSRLRVDEIDLGSITTEITNGTIEDDYIQPTAITYIVDYIQEEEIVGASLEQRNMAIFMGVLVGVLPFEVCAMIFSSLMIYANKRRNECC